MLVGGLAAGLGGRPVGEETRAVAVHDWEWGQRSWGRPRLRYLRTNGKCTGCGISLPGWIGCGRFRALCVCLVAELTATSSSPMRSSTGKRITLLSTLDVLVPCSLHCWLGGDG
ncbi:hypothetical protein BASA81_002235 [Batrachochytrium salamandrivorans]|nr:hypothetical protein BASA81_002235 [Batrachochytrium salamandrivorans]